MSAQNDIFHDIFYIIYNRSFFGGSQSIYICHNSHRMGPKPMTHKLTCKEQKVSFNETKRMTTEMAEIQIQIITHKAGQGRKQN